MRELPSGTVTFLFTDIEGSTRLLHEHGDGYADLLAEHRRVLREAFDRHGGIEVDTQGDAFFVAFPRATDAAAAAVDAQRELSDGPVRVRMGIHTGEPILTGEGYAGMDVHRAARIAAVGHGGQVLVSQTSRDLLGDQVPLRDLGAHRLKDLTEAQRIYQLGNDVEFPPLKSLNRTNLPVTATALVGREQEVSDLCGLLGNGTRLVTVTGAGGSGKTRLALQVAAELSDGFQDGVFFVPLAPVQEADLLLPTIEQTVGVTDAADLRESRALLVLDNMEHLLAAAGEVGSLLANAPALKLLATSRAPLRLSGEHEYALDPLPQDEAVELFLERARAVRRDVTADEAVSEICKRLDGLPLALELAASRVKAFDPPLLLERLERRLPLLTGGARDAPERQQTLRAAIEWSYELLEEPDRKALRGLAVFAGSFSLDAAESVTGTDFDGVAALVDWSLVKPIGEGRFFMLETIREYAAEQLQRAGEEHALREGHLAFFLELAVEAEPELTGPDQAKWYRRLADEQDNIREALEHACAGGDAERAQMLSGTIWRFWMNRAQIDEAARWYERALSLPGEVSPIAHARALFGAAHVTEAVSDTATIIAAFEEVVEALRVSREPRWLVLALTHLAVAYAESRDFDATDRANEEAIAIARETDDLRGQAIVLSNTAYQREIEGDAARAITLYEEAIAALRELDDVFSLSGIELALASVMARTGRVEETAGMLAESIRLAASIDSLVSISQGLMLVGVLALERGDAATYVRLRAAGESFRQARGFELDVMLAGLLAEADSNAREALGSEFDDAWAEGAELEIDHAVQLALASID